MQPSVTSALLAFGLCLTAAGCSDSAQFTNGTGPSAGTVGTSSTAADATAEESELGPETEVPDSLEMDVPKVADAALDPSEVSAGQTLPGSQTTIDQFKAACSQGTKKTLTQKIRFPETANCRFGTAGNLGRKNFYLQAMEAQTTSITLPGKAQLCGVSVNSAVSTIQYDDFMILTLNGYVLLSSNAKILEGLEGTAGTAYKWDFNRIRGVPVDFDSASYCMGTDASICTVPVTDTSGQFQVQVDPTSLIHLADQVVENHTLNFALVATGDNDDLDCWHTELNLDFTLQYVEAP
ncbi:MAG TPA: hypothetical protein VE954_17740 [Oligoflexus sp.]|uniref:hypothetical protein n=1 Tax=Oligoflexus sp. TaxID=1971216 RepID=UPI002D654ED6|nr:hypothetical protein [Oligoflexus sp.]HYX34941.1 hypothetical protein [Oligoflexus sp.]